MPPVRTIPAIKPTKTERSHEENQERAYIAASRRSDRSLEARVESARRASEIHEKRTGRRLRVTEQDVINEEMYEEEDDNIPWRYRHLALLPNLSTLSPEFRRRVEAQLVLEMERSRMVDPTGMFQQPQFMNPGMMQMPQAGQMYPPSMFQFGQHPAAMSPQMPSYPHQSPLLSAQLSARAAQRHSPYPLPGTPRDSSSRPNPHHRSASIANPQELSAYQQQNSPSAQTPPAGSADSRRMSLPPQTTSTPRSSHSPNIQPKPDATARSGNANTSSSQNTPKISLHGHPQFAQPYQFSYPESNPFAPLTSTLPINTQQILGGEGMFPFMNDFESQMLKPDINSAGMNQPMYSYNPNPSSAKHSKKGTYEQFKAPSSTGLEQTLTMPTTLESSNAHGRSYDGGFLDTPLSANNNALTSSTSDHPGSAFSGEQGFELDAFGSSGAGSPADFNSFVNDDFFGDQQYAF